MHTRWASPLALVSFQLNSCNFDQWSWIHVAADWPHVECCWMRCGLVFALSFRFNRFSGCGLPMPSCWTRATTRACRRQPRRPALWSMSLMVSGGHSTCNLLAFSSISICFSFPFLFFFFCSVFFFVCFYFPRRKPCGYAEKRRQWQLPAKQPQFQPGSGIGSQRGGPMAPLAAGHPLHSTLLLLSAYQLWNQAATPAASAWVAASARASTAAVNDVMIIKLSDYPHSKL